MQGKELSRCVSPQPDAQGPGTVSTTRTSGDGGVGSTYRNISQFLGRKTELTYTTVILRPDEFIELMGENKTLVAHDQMTITSEGSA